MKHFLCYIPWTGPRNNSSVASANNWAHERRKSRDNAPSIVPVVPPPSSCQVDQANDPGCSNISLFVSQRNNDTPLWSSRRPRPNRYQLPRRRSPRKPSFSSLLTLLFPFANCRHGLVSPPSKPWKTSSPLDRKKESFEERID